METHPWLVARKQVLDNYRLPAEGVTEADALFAQLEQLASGCADQGTFEQQLAASPLSQQYNDLLARYAKYFMTNGKTTDEQVEDLQAAAAQSAAQDHMESMVKRELHTAAMQALPDEVRQLKYGGLRVVPVIGPIIQWIDNIKWISRLFGRK